MQVQKSIKNKLSMIKNITSCSSMSGDYTGYLISREYPACHQEFFRKNKYFPSRGSFISTINIGASPAAEKIRKFHNNRMHWCMRMHCRTDASFMREI